MNLNASSYRGIGDVSLAFWTSELQRVGSPLLPDAAALYAAAQPHTALCLAQMWRECSYETDRLLLSPEDHNPLNLRPNYPGGTVETVPGATGIRHDYLTFASPVDCVREWKRRLFEDATYKGGTYLQATTLAEAMALYAPVGDAHPLTGDANETYAADIATILARFAANNTPQEGTPMAYPSIVPGLPGGPLTTIAPVRVKLIPSGRTYQRPGIKAAKPRRSVQHGNGNSDSSAKGEAIYLVDMAAEGRQASYHSATDDLETWVMVPVDEVTWQAADGAGPGNMNGLSNEMVEDADIWASPARAKQCVDNAADFMGGCAARLDIADPEQHWTFNYMLPPSLRHDCPNKLRYRKIGTENAWTYYVRQWRAAKAAELRRMGGVVVTPAPPTYAKPIEIPELKALSLGKYDTATGVVSRDGDDFIFVADVVEATKDTPRLQYASSSAPRVGADLKKGERFVVSWLVKAADGLWYYITPPVYSQSGALLWGWTRVRQADTKRIADAPVIPQEADALGEAA